MNGQRIHLSVVESTNSYTTALLSQSVIQPWAIVTADEQTSGRGQRGRSWMSEKGKNVVLSMLVPAKVPLDKQYLVSAAISLAMIDLLEQLDVHAEVKWPNDIMVSGKKLAGILIENQVKGSMVETSVVGIGLNVNQTTFDRFPWRATSLKLETGRDYDVEELLQTLTEAVRARWTEIESKPELLIREVNERLFCRNKEVLFTLNSQATEATIVGVDASGALEVIQGGEHKKFQNGEIRMKRIFS